MITMHNSVDGHCPRTCICFCDRAGTKCSIISQYVLYSCKGNPRMTHSSELSSPICSLLAPILDLTLATHLPHLAKRYGISQPSSGKRYKSQWSQSEWTMEWNWQFDRD